ncbi:hypothetical protein EJ08DRAFT_645179 [Tothia fuscella]|uniref:Uncharacterized protein n=1 Tax=Tothia fuscella TaxID=1048955 RepID=A0A9P4P2F9_9PEZI|nr:hypothetical protein EJ08DRAFT_645179 [Tothia fuscella]
MSYSSDGASDGVGAFEVLVGDADVDVGATTVENVVGMALKELKDREVKETEVEDTELEGIGLGLEDPEIAADGVDERVELKVEDPETAATGVDEGVELEVEDPETAATSVDGRLELEVEDLEIVATGVDDDRMELVSERAVENVLGVEYKELEIAEDERAEIEKPKLKVIDLEVEEAEIAATSVDKRVELGSEGALKVLFAIDLGGTQASNDL